MEFKSCLVVLLIVALAMVAAVESSKIHNSNAAWGVRHNNMANVGDVIGEDNEMLMVSETGRRQLAVNGRYISYEALKKNVPPCGHHGNSYYDCSARDKVNPYTRGCSYLTKCARRMADRG